MKTAQDSYTITIIVSQLSCHHGANLSYKQSIYPDMLTIITRDER